MKLIPRKATYAPGEALDLDLLGARGVVAVALWHLDRQVDEVHLAVESGDAALVRFDGPAEGGYAVVAIDDRGGTARTAVDVLANPFTRPRYGFVADFPAGHEPAALADTARRLHLNLIQFYDWAHRYAQLVPDTEEYVDPIGRHLSLSTVKAMTSALRDAGSLSMGYAAVYAVGGVDWDDWQQAGLFKTDGSPHRFADDLLLVVDPANPEWMKHFAGDLRQSMAAVGFDGFHLDSYGWPKRAFRADGSVCDLNDAFSVLLEHLRDDVSDSRLLFNNVNDFPTWSTAKTRQDGTYIEVWAPHRTLGHLSALLDRARAFRPGSTPILAAYLSVYGKAPADAADAAARLTMATIFSHGGTHLLIGEADRLLIDPYYPRNHAAADNTRELMQDWYDFLVRYGDLLLSPSGVDVTRSYTGGINEDLIFVTPDGVRISTDPEPGTVWVRVVRTSRGLVLHLINLSDQHETDWDEPKTPITGTSGIRLRVLQTLAILPPQYASPDAAAALRELPVTADGLYYEIELPELGAWTMVVLPDPDGWHAL